MALYRGDSYRGVPAVDTERRRDGAPKRKCEIDCEASTDLQISPKKRGLRRVHVSEGQ